MDAAGKPFSVAAETTEVSGIGARLRGVPEDVEGEIIGIQYNDQKARFRVVWAGSEGREGQIGVQSLECNKSIWAAALEEYSPQNGADPSTVPDSATRGERRRHPRYQCRGEVELRAAESRTTVKVALTDISLGGCYAESFSPLPVGTGVDLLLKVAGVQVSIQGVVRTSHPSMGMGINFVSADAEPWKRLAQMVNQVSGVQTPATGESTPDTAQQASRHNDLNVLVSLLEKKGVISRDEFLSELRMYERGRE